MSAWLNRLLFKSGRLLLPGISLKSVVELELCASNVVTDRRLLYLKAFSCVILQLYYGDQSLFITPFRLFKVKSLGAIELSTVLLEI